MASEGDNADQLSDIIKQRKSIDVDVPRRPRDMSIDQYFKVDTDF